MKFVMMIPLRRCGSNAIRLRMNLHPDFYSPYPLHLCDLLPLPLGIDPDNDLDYFQMVVGMVGLQRHSLVPWDNVVLDPIHIHTQLKDKPIRSAHQIYWEMIRQAGEIHGAKVVMDKSQDSVCDFEEIMNLFRDTDNEFLFLDVVRDPRAQVSSMNDAVIYDYDTFLNTERWVKAREWSDQIHKQYPNKIITLRYEDFVLDQETTMRTICRFIGIPFDPIVLDVEKSVEALEMSKTSPLWETNYSKPIPEYISKYLNKLTTREVEHIEAKTLKWMEQFGYAPITAHTTLLPYGEEQAREQSETRREIVWKDLKEKHPYDYILRKNRKKYIDNHCFKT